MEEEEEIGSRCTMTELGGEETPPKRKDECKTWMIRTGIKD